MESFFFALVRRMSGEVFRFVEVHRLWFLVCVCVCAVASAYFARRSHVCRTKAPYERHGEASGEGEMSVAWECLHDRSYQSHFPTAPEGGARGDEGICKARYGGGNFSLSVWFGSRPGVYPWASSFSGLAGGGHPCLAWRGLARWLGGLVKGNPGGLGIGEWTRGCDPGAWVGLTV
jgi:hypothetical protein